MHSSKIKIPEKTANSVVDLALDTIEAKKQAIVFVGTKKGAEKTAEDIAKKIKTANAELEEISDKILNALPKSTKQCERLALIIKKGIAFHHAGLVAKQKELIEDNFRKGTVRIICCTPTLASGVDLPAFRTIIKDLKRYSKRGYDFIPVLEYQQMCLPFDEKIITNHGYLNIGSIVENKIKCRVLSYNLKRKKVEFKRIIKYYSRKTNKLIELITNKRFKIRLTENHPVFSDCGWIPAKEIKVGNAVLFTRITDANTSTPDFFEFLPQTGIFVKNTGFLITELKMKCNLSEKEIAKRFRIHHKIMYHYKNDLKAMPISLVLNLCSSLKLDKKSVICEVKTSYGSTVNVPATVDEDILWLAGFIATDGNIQRTIDKRTKSEYIKIRLFNTNVKLINKAKRILKTILGNSPFIYMRDNCYCLEIGSTLLARILKKHFNIPFKNKTRKIRAPRFLFKCSKSLIGAYIAGVFDGDGSYAKQASKKFKSTYRYRILFVTSSKGFAKDLQTLLLKMGIISKFSSDYSIKTVQLKGKAITFKAPKYYIIINKIKDILIFQKYSKPLKCKIDVNYSKYHNLDVHYSGSEQCDFLKIIKKNVVKCYKPIPVYNLQIKCNNNYFASNFLVHNCGRAGRPKFDTFGESICISSSDNEKETIKERFINGVPEEIFSKLAAEPVLRTYLLSLIAAEFVTTKKQIMEFFKKTFWAHQYKDMKHLRGIINKMLKLLEEYKFITLNEPEFVSANEIDAKDKVSATLLGKRVAELYLDPLTANHIIQCLETAVSRKSKISEIALLQMITHTLELRPLLSVKVREWEEIQQKIGEIEEELLEEEPSAFEEDYDEFAASVKTAVLFKEWIEEKDEEFLLEKYNVRPGELHTKIDLADWLLYSAAELARILKMQPLIVELVKLRMRINYGAKEELLPLLKLQNIGRARARKMFSSGIKDIAAVKKAELSALASILGKNIAIDVKKQVGQDFAKEIVPENKRKGQISLKDY